MELLNRITKSQFEEAVPIKELLENSIYYPASEFDGGVVKHFSKEVQSFIYCDYATGEDELNNVINKFYGYKLLFERNVKESELTPNGWTQIKPPMVNEESYFKYKEFFKKPFCRWSIYEREDDLDDDHGAKRFSVLYIGGEGVATYNALYYSNKTTAKILAIIQPGTGFGFNWTDFRDPDDALGYTVLNNPNGVPDMIVYGGYGKDYNDLKWRGYTKTRTIKKYYYSKDSFDFGEVTVWERGI